MPDSETTVLPAGAVAFGDAAFTPRVSTPLSEGEPVTIGIRPEQFGATGAGSCEAALNVEVVENLGGTSIVHGKLGDGQSVLVEQRGDDRAKAGDIVKIGFDPRAALVFSSDGQRVR